MWTAPGLRELVRVWVGSSGLSSRPHMTAAKMVFRAASSKQGRGL